MNTWRVTFLTVHGQALHRCVVNADHFQAALLLGNADMELKGRDYRGQRLDMADAIERITRVEIARLTP